MAIEKALLARAWRRRMLRTARALVGFSSV
jgi:hypothetical protein